MPTDLWLDADAAEEAVDLATFSQQVQMAGVDFGGARQAGMGMAPRFTVIGIADPLDPAKIDLHVSGGGALELITFAVEGGPGRTAGKVSLATKR